MYYIERCNMQIYRKRILRIPFPTLTPALAVWYSNENEKNELVAKQNAGVIQSLRLFSP